MRMGISITFDAIESNIFTQFVYSIAQTKVSWESLAAGVKKTCRNLKKREWVFLSQLILLFATILYILKQVHYVAFK